MDKRTVQDDIDSTEIGHGRAADDGPNENIEPVTETVQSIADVDSEDGTRPISTYRLEASQQTVDDPHCEDQESAADGDDVDEENDTEAADDLGEEKAKSKRKGGMVRWGYLAPRAALLAVMLTVVWLLLNPVLRLALIYAGQAAVSARVEIDSLSTSITDTSIELQGIVVADPDHEMKNLVEIDTMRLDLDAAGLLKKKLIVSDASITGLRFDTDRTTSGFLEPPTEPSEPKETDATEDESSGGVMPDWLTGQLGAIQEDAESQLARFESIRMAERLGTQWPTAYEDLRSRADSIEANVKEIRQLYEQRRRAMNDPQAAIQLAQDAAGRLGLLRTEAEAIARKLEELRIRFDEDKQSVIELGRADLKRLNEMATEIDVGPRELTEMLIGDMISRRVKNAVFWIGYIKRLMPDKEKSLAKIGTVRKSGVDIHFPITDKKPHLLIERMAIEGELPFDDFRYRFTGEIRDITNDPRQLGRPIECELRLEGPATCNIHLTIDATGDVLRQRLIVSCPNLQLEQQTLGRADRLAIDVSPGRMEIGADIVVEDDRIEGTIVTRQPRVQLTMSTRPDTPVGRWNPRLQQLVDSIRSLDIRVDLTGTLKRPKVAIQSNLGDQLAGGMRAAITAEITARRDQLIQLTQDKINGRLVSLDRFVAEKRQEIEDRIRLDEAKIGPIARLLQGGGGQDPVAAIIGQAGGQLQNAIMGEIQNAAGGAVQNSIGGAVQGIMNNLPGLPASHVLPPMVQRPATPYGQPVAPSTGQPMNPVPTVPYSTGPRTTPQQPAGVPTIPGVPTSPWRTGNLPYGDLIPR